MNFTDMKNAVESVSNEKRVPKEAVFAAIESALATATKRRVREDAKFRVSIDWDESKCETFRVWTVVDPELMGENQSEEDAEDLTSELDWKNQEFNPDAHLTLDQAQEKQPSLKLGDEWEEPWPSIDQGRIMAQIVKQVIAQKLREAERNRVAEEYRDSVGKLVSGTVKRHIRV